MRKALLTLGAFVVLGLAACGGSGAGKGVEVQQGNTSAPGDGNPSSPVDGNPGTTKSGLALSVLDADGVDVTTQPRVTVGSQLTLRIVATDSNGAPVQNALVTVKAPEVAVLLPAVGTALTDSGGIARIQVEGLIEGAGLLEVEADIDATLKTATLAMTVSPSSTPPQAPEALLVAYVSASIHTLKIGGTFLESTSMLTFKVVNQEGQAVPNQRVDFAPSLTTGGLSVSPAFAITSADGTVTTNVRAGVIPTPVRVTATATLPHTGARSSAQSLQLSISSGQPSQKFFSLSAETLNIDGCNFDGAKTGVTARAGDQFGNPVPDGTTINFVTEGGRIGAGSIGSCETADGVCSVVLESQEYRPKGYGFGNRNNCRVSVLAYALGEETFSDANNNGTFDSGEPYEDLPDAFLNIEPLDRTSFNARSILTPDLVGDRLIPFQNDGRITPRADGAWGAAHVRRSHEIVFSSRQAVATFEPDEISFQGCSSTQTGLTRSAIVKLADVNGNPLAAGSAITVEATGASAGTVTPASVPNTAAPGTTDHEFILTADPSRCAGGASEGAAGSARVIVKLVGGVERAFTVNVVY